MDKLQARVQQRGEGGFTLIELLVVIAILAILAGVVVFAVGNSTANAEKAACQTEAASLVTAATAAKTANLVNTTKEDIWNYLDKANIGAVNASTKYFDVASGLSATPVTGVTFSVQKAVPDCTTPANIAP